MNRRLRARLLLEEALALGLDLDDLVAAATGGAKPVTVAAWIDEIAPTFGPSTAATYLPYWRLAARMVGDRYLAELTTTDLAGVVEAAAERARSRRPDSRGRASRETCIAALRALYASAVDAGHVSANPAAALRKPLRTTSRRRALDDHELAGLADAIRATSTDPTSTFCWSGSTLRPAPAARAPSISGAETSTRTAPQSGFARRTTPSASSPRRPRWSPAWWRTPPIEMASAQVMPCSVVGKVSRSPGAATTGSSPVPANASAGTTGPRCRHTCCATPPSLGLGASPGTPSPKPSPVTPRPL